MKISLQTLAIAALLLAGNQLASAQIVVRFGGQPFPAQQHAQPQNRPVTFAIGNQGHPWPAGRANIGPVLSREPVRLAFNITPSQPQYRQPVWPQPQNRQPVFPQPQPQPQPRPQPAVTPSPANTQSAAAKTINYVNQLRANPASFSNLHPSLADSDVVAMPALTPNSSLQTAAQRKAEWMASTGRFEHVMQINGQSVGMNQWMREAGYELAAYLPNDATNFECLFTGSARGDVSEVGIRAINAFLSEGKDGGHVQGMLGRGWRTNVKDIGVGIATSADGKVYFSMVIATFDPAHP